jgi:hypothetical protein
MGTQVTLTIPERLYERARQLAAQRHMNVEEVLTKVLDATEDALEMLVPEWDEAVEREMAAYIALHPLLWEKYPCQHVAIYDGELVDRDEDYGALYERIEERYPDEFVWLTTVKEEPIETLVMRSPRFMEEDE